MIGILAKKAANQIERLGKLTNLIIKNSTQEKRATRTRKKGIRLNSYLLEGIGSFLEPSVFSAGRMMLLIFLLYVFLGVFSTVPMLYPLELAMGMILIFIAIAMIQLGGKMGKLPKRLPYHVPNYDFWGGIFLLGTLGLILNYLQVGTPLFNPDIRPYYHNMLWSVSMIFYVMGMTMTAINHRNRNVFVLLSLLSIILSVLSGFRTDFIIFLFPLLFFFYFFRKSGRSAFLLALLVVSVIAIIGIKYLLIIFGGSALGVEQISFARAGFSLYVLSILIKNVGILGLTHGAVWLNSFVLQFFGFPIAPIGAIVSEMVINMAKSHASTLVGPLYLEFGVLGVIIGSLVLGFLCELPHRIYKTTRNYFFLGLYSINLSILLVWVETGIVQYYLAFLFFVIGFWCLQWLRR
ncbi:MAG: hypothetical protein ACE5J7_03385 [Candidatus Aenigmatarchaeota archaeon]